MAVIIEKNTVLSISNLLGQVIYLQALDDYHERAIVSSSTLGSGHYFCSIVANGKVLVAKKRIVIN